MAIVTISPSIGQLLKSFESLGSAEIEAKLQRAAGAFQSYRKTSLADRTRWMLKAAAILQQEKEAYAKVMSTERGQTFRSAVDEVAKCAWVCRYYAENAERFLADEVVETGAKRSCIRYQPLGPVLAVMPWNFPFWQVLRFAAPALMAGNVGPLKHASIVPQIALLIEELFRPAGFPHGAFQTLLIGSREVGRILGDPRVMAAKLTGSQQAGIEVGIGAAKRIKKVVLELGGSDPFIVMPSANLEIATSTAVKARIFNNGQSCIAAKRFIVPESIAHEFEHLFAEKMAALKVGDPFKESTELGPLSTRQGVNDLDRDVRKTVQADAKILTGGKPLRTGRETSMPRRCWSILPRTRQFTRKNCLVRWPAFSAQKTSTTQSALPTTPALAWVPAPAATTSRNRRCLCSSIEWWHPIRAFRSAA
jgi:succinate-semialdehyde dehydrogenase/glutarate-semialdehyde dehydrogenase